MSDIRCDEVAVPHAGLSWKEAQFLRHHLCLLGGVDHAIAMGANAVTGVRFDSSDIADGIVEIVAYGTAVVL